MIVEFAARHVLFELVWITDSAGDAERLSGSDWRVDWSEFKYQQTAAKTDRQLTHYFRDICFLQTFVLWRKPWKYRWYWCPYTLPNKEYLISHSIQNLPFLHVTRISVQTTWFSSKLLQNDGALNFVVFFRATLYIVLCTRYLIIDPSLVEQPCLQSEL